jgi:hypothetical protein
LRAQAISLRTFSGAPVGASKKNGSSCGRFPCQNPPGSRGSSRALSAGAPTSPRIRNVPQRRGRARWGARRSAIPNNPAPGVHRSGNPKILSQPSNGDENRPRRGPLAFDLVAWRVRRDSRKNVEQRNPRVEAGKVPPGPSWRSARSPDKSPPSTWRGRSRTR